MPRKIETVADLEQFMDANNAGLKSVMPISGNEKFTFITSRYSPNCSVKPDIAQAFIKKHDKNLKKIALNEASTTLYVLR